MKKYIALVAAVMLLGVTASGAFADVWIEDDVKSTVTVGIYYEADIHFNCNDVGAGIESYGVSSGLPYGISTSNMGDGWIRIYGNPTQAGVYTFTATVTNTRYVSASKTYTIEVKENVWTGSITDSYYLPDKKLRDYVRANFDTDGNGYLSKAEIANITEIDVNSKDITSLAVVKYFTALKKLSCSHNKLTELDVSGCTALETLDCSYNKLTDLEVSGCTALETLDCSNNQLAALDISGCPNLSTFEHDNNLKVFKEKDEIDEFMVAINADNFPDKWFRRYVSENFDKNGNGYLSDYEIAKVTRMCLVVLTTDYTNFISSLQGVEYFTALTYLHCSYIYHLTSLDVSKNSALTHLYCSDTGLTTLDVSKNSALKVLNCSYNKLTILDVSKNLALTNLNCSYNQLAKLDVSKNLALTNLNCSYNQLVTLDVSKNPALTNLNCSYNKLTELDVSENSAIVTLYCHYNQLTSLNVSGCTALKRLWCHFNKLTTIDISECPNLSLNNIYFWHDSNLEVITEVAISEVNFPDEAFRAYVSENFDTDGNGYLSRAEIANVTEIDVQNKGITSLKGVKYFTALTTLDCSWNQLTALDVRHNLALKRLQCGRNQLTELDVRRNTALEFLYFPFNQLTAIDVSKNSMLTVMYCNNNQLTTLDVSGCTALTEFCGYQDFGSVY